MRLNERLIHRIFETSVVLKGLHALIECAGGLALYLISTSEIVRLVNAATQDELVEDPRDAIALLVRGWAGNLSLATERFYAFYLLSHGLIKLLLVAGLLKGKLWSYPASLAALAVFVAYQLYRYSYTFSPGLIVLTVFDLLVMVLIWHEYRLMQRRRP